MSYIFQTNCSLEMVQLQLIEMAIEKRGVSKSEFVRSALIKEANSIMKNEPKETEQIHG